MIVITQLNIYETHGVKQCISKNFVGEIIHHGVTVHSLFTNRNFLVMFFKFELPENMKLRFRLLRGHSIIPFSQNAQNLDLPPCSHLFDFGNFCKFLLKGNSAIRFSYWNDDSEKRKGFRKNGGFDYIPYNGFSWQ